MLFSMKNTTGDSALGRALVRLVRTERGVGAMFF